METTEQKILAAAEEEFLLKGYAGAKTVVIAERAGVTHAMLHYYFRTKERLFQQVFTQKVQALGESLISAFTSPGKTLRERLRAGIALHFDFLAANPTLPRFVINELVSNPANQTLMRDNLGSLLGRIASGMQRELDELARRGDICPVNIVDLLLDIVSLNGFAFMVLPVIEPLVVRSPLSLPEFLERRKQENIEVIMKRLEPLNLEDRS